MEVRKFFAILGIFLFVANAAEAKIDSDQKDLLKCVRKTLREDGTNDQDLKRMQDFVSSFLTPGGLATSKKLLSLKIDQCEDRRFDTEDLKKNKEIQEKAKFIVKGLKDPWFKCQRLSGNVSAALLVEIGIGAEYMICRGSDATVRLYSGPKVVAGIGLGVAAKVASSEYILMRGEGNSGKFTSSRHSNIILVIGGVIDNFAWEVEEEYGVGAQWTMGGSYSPKMRLPNLPNDWDFVVQEIISGKKFDYLQHYME